MSQVARSWPQVARSLLRETRSLSRVASGRKVLFCGTYRPSNFFWRFGPHEISLFAKKGTHRHSRWFFICGPCPRILATRHVALHVLASAYCPYRQPASGLHLPEHGQLVAVLVLLQLILDIRRNLCRIFASCVDIVAAAPKFPTLVLNLQGGKLFVQHQAALPL